MCMEKSDWERTTEFHGHVCPGLAIGFRATQLALRRLEADRAGDEELVAVVENDACGVDAVQVLTGCTFGKGNLIFRDFGKHVYTIGQRSSSRAIRISVRPGAFHNHEYTRLRRLAGPDMDPGEAETLAELRDRHIQSILAAGEDAFDIRETVMTLPRPARIFPSVTCYRCGESVMETRARVREGKPVCIPCREAE